MASPRLGIQLPEVERVVTWDEYLRMSQLAESAGFASLWLGDHLLYRGDGRPERGPWDAWTLLGAIAASTERIEIGPLVACLAFHPPAVVAKMASTINEISAGRLVLGVGAGWNEPEFRAFGLPFDHRAARFEEAFTIVRSLVRGDRVTLDGRFHRVDDVVQLPRPRFHQSLMIGSTGPRVLKAALPHVDWWNTWFDWFGNDAGGFAELNDSISQQCREVGRDPSTVKRSACLLVNVDPSATERPIPTEYSAANTVDVAARVRELGEAGADEVILVSNPIDERSIGRLAELVL
jgi:alkanesulfonate monooxygenase SsuD/methylene tetrahydromethanopterin reductase-like flavin-dependent oxidoreductase (luciferase family)